MRSTILCLALLAALLLACGAPVEARRHTHHPKLLRELAPGLLAPEKHLQAPPTWQLCPQVRTGRGSEHACIEPNNLFASSQDECSIRAPPCLSAPFFLVLVSSFYFISHFCATPHLCQAPTVLAVNNVTLNLVDRSMGLVLAGTVSEQLTSGALVAIGVLLDGGAM